MWKVVYSTAAQKHSLKVARHPALRRKVESLLRLLEQDPFGVPPRYERLVGGLHGCYSRRINVQHRLVYQVMEEAKVVKVLAMRSHYE
jgi:Txe/YoeB family toxin of toxin-antitoxin system